MFDATGMSQYLEHLQEFSEKRVDAISADFSLSGDYIKNRREKCALYEKLQEVLPPDLQDILSSYSDCENVLQGKTQTYFYDQGFWDGVRLMKLLLLGDGRSPYGI